MYVPFHSMLHSLGCYCNRIQLQSTQPFEATGPASRGLRVSPVASTMRRIPRLQADGQRVLVNQAQFVTVTVALINGLSSPEYVFYTYNLFSFLASPRVIGTRGLLREPNGEGTWACCMRVAAND